MTRLTKHETREPYEADNIAEMTDILLRKMERDYAKGNTKRDAHPKTLGLLRAKFIINADLPADLKVGIFANTDSYECWVRFSNASGKIQSDAVKDARGVAIKLMATKTKSTQDETPLGQDFILMSSPTMPLGTVAMFRDAVYYTIESSPVLLAMKFFLTGKASALLGLLALRISPNSMLDIRYWSTTPYRFGSKAAVKYSLIPNFTFRDVETDMSGDSYLTDAIDEHLKKHTASFDFCIQIQKEGMPIEDAGVLWHEELSPFIKLATVLIPSQRFRTKERADLAESLSFSPGNAFPEHAPLGGLNRARIAIYEALTSFRHQRDSRTNIK